MKAGSEENIAGDGMQYGERDELYERAIFIVVETRKASITRLQHQLRVGYHRAACLLEAMEAAGILTPLGPNGREVTAEAIKKYSSVSARH